jgi:alkylation response protein AidB-like acyl-CoA dehydrogenase
VTTFPGYALAAELNALREQIRRMFRDELLPIEQRTDPDAPEIPEEDYRRLAAKTKTAGLWCLGASEQHGGGGLDTIAMSALLR